MVAGMEVVVGVHAGISQEGLVACLEKARKGWLHVGKKPGMFGRMSRKSHEGLVACQEKARKGWLHVGEKAGRVGCM